MTSVPEGLDPASVPDTTVDAKAAFGFETSMTIPAF
ncbi:MAG: cobaltochelatase subunit CobS, partial [Alphaproteobacteria bacterium]|nr:cobaltochelatase subunit CobS [Alphaproteobacteria bacterium]MBI1329145.1 cobaltochelatase subunit CobS [Alphaproteobacteria bacterium]